VEEPLTFGIAVDGGTTSYMSRCDTNHDGLDLWGPWKTNGSLGDVDDARPSLQGETIGAAVSTELSIPAGATKEVVFAVAWDMPVARFGCGEGYVRRYCRWYNRASLLLPDADTLPLAVQLARDAIRDVGKWEEALRQWQNPILTDERLPVWYRSQLFQELHYLVEGGSFWLERYPILAAPTTPSKPKDEGEANLVVEANNAGGVGKWMMSLFGTAKCTPHPLRKEPDESCAASIVASGEASDRITEAFIKISNPNAMKGGLQLMDPRSGTWEEIHGLDGLDVGRVYITEAGVKRIFVFNFKYHSMNDYIILILMINLKIPT